MTMRTLSKNKVILGLSGGVDSTTAALLLKEKGMDVTGFYFDVLGNNKEGEAAEKLAKELEIQFIYRDVSKAFSELVMDNFCQEYYCGRTPNPCIVCNPAIKFKQLLDVADQEGAYYIATGHYTRVRQDNATGIFYIQRGASEKKDQSYMMYRLGQDVLSRLILPLGDFQNKEQTRNVAREKNLTNAEAADSQEICFVDEQKEDYVSFIQKRGYTAKKGNFIDAKGNVLGQHQGLMHYTIGQRKGLGIALGKPAFVTKMNPEENTVTLGDNEDLFCQDVFASNCFFTETGSKEMPSVFQGTMRVKAKVRYAAKPADATITLTENGQLKTTFDEPQRAATPGQSIVFYDGENLIGGGFITG